jgi:clan AA aspartic protease (TIGR02281 family)
MTMKLIKSLSILLSISIGANLWFSWNWYKQSQLVITQNQEASDERISAVRHSWTNTVNENTTSLETLANSNLPKKSLDLNVESGQENQAAHFKALVSLAKAQEYEKLEYETRNYLRLYPQDIEAMLLEAKSYYHNKPLNIALVHYHQLLSKPLSPQQHQDVEKLIAVNTTRVIQQFSGDGAWDLLAEFLEPLVQIAPLNRQYLMALARAYGMQSQLTLMEAVLANFPSNDVRSSRLRENIIARLNSSSTEESLGESPQNATDVLIGDRRADVLLKQEQGHFVTAAKLHNTSVNLLIDTGASTTAISDVKFNTINAEQLEFIGLFNVNTAGGSIEAPIYKVRNMTIGQRTLVNTSVLILPSENLGRYDGLLGMNVLSQFDLIYDAASRTMRMYKKS